MTTQKIATSTAKTTYIPYTCTCSQVIVLGRNWVLQISNLFVISMFTYAVFESDDSEQSVQLRKLTCVLARHTRCKQFSHFVTEVTIFAA